MLMDPWDAVVCIIIIDSFHFYLVKELGFCARHALCCLVEQGELYCC